MPHSLEQKRIINIVDNIDSVNAGIWLAAISTAPKLSEYGLTSELWFPASGRSISFKSVIAVQLHSTASKYMAEVILKRSLNRNTDIIVTHGSWQFCTRWGYGFKKLGFKWIYTPQGMLEPWAMRQKWIKKKIYFTLFENRMAASASVIRSVSFPESVNLKKLFSRSNVVHIPNGVEITGGDTNAKSNTLTYLFMSRLHHKKGVNILATAWLQSLLNNDSRFKLIIAGPDQGELSELKNLIRKSNNIEYLGPVYDKQKEEVLRRSSFYILPSFSEGFPTSVLEAMSYGLISLISPGCNLPEAFQEDVALKIYTEEASIAAQLNNTLKFNAHQIRLRSERSKEFVTNNYSLHKVASLQNDVYQQLLNL